MEYCFQRILPYIFFYLKKKQDVNVCIYTVNDFNTSYRKYMYYKSYGWVRKAVKLILN